MVEGFFEDFIQVCSANLVNFYLYFFFISKELNHGSGCAVTVTITS